jgi:hypothetical protein
MMFLKFIFKGLTFLRVLFYIALELSTIFISFMIFSFKHLFMTAVRIKQYFVYKSFFDSILISFIKIGINQLL